VRLDTELREEEAAAGARAHLADGDVADVPVTEIAPELPVTPELNAIELVPLDGIRDRKVRELCFEIAYGDAVDGTVKRIREIVEKFPGDVPISIALRDVPKELESQATDGNGKLRIRLNPHFRVQPGPALSAAFEELRGKLHYQF